MPTIRKMLGKTDPPYIVSLMRKIETQSKAAVAKWCMDYTEAVILPIFESGELYPTATVSKMETVQGEGARQVNRFLNLFCP